MLKAAALGAVLALGAYRVWGPRPAPGLPPHLLGHPIVYREGLIPEEDFKVLNELVREWREYPTVTADLAFYKTVHEHIGEAQPLGADGRCSHPYLMPDSKREQCILPGRIDIGRRWIATGGVEGLKERYEDIVSRVQAFSRYIFDVHPAVQKLFNNTDFQAAAKAVCPADQQILHPFQFNVIVNVPGQTVALHTDAPYFKRASRFQFPQWLLAAMVHSGLFQEDFIHQVQVVAYLHAWEDPTGAKRGDFVYWDEDTAHPKSVPAKPRSGSSVDGSKVVHAATVYRPQDKPPRLDKSKKNALIYTGNEQWQVQSDGAVLANLTSDDLRISIVYRAMCFGSEQEKADYLASKDSNYMTLDDILGRFKADLAARGKYSAAQLEAMPRLELALAIMDQYISYPASPTALLPVNYCVADLVAPALKPLVELLC